MINVVSCIDGSPGAFAVCDAGAWASQRMATPLQLLHVLDKSESPARTDLSGSLGVDSREHLLDELVELDAKRNKLALEHGKLMLEAAKNRAAEKGAQDITTLQRHSSLLESILELQDDTRLLIMGRLGESHAGQAMAVGSQLESVIRAVHKPILITLDQFAAPSNFMIAFDGRSVTQNVLDTLIASPLLQGLPCHLVAVNNTSLDRGPELQAAADKLTGARFAVSCTVLQGEVQAELQAYQQEHGIDLMVMGAYGHSRIRRLFLGSNTTDMVSASTIPLIIVR
ncbi:MAG: universal stress protein [Gammaproteobacteria bacterium]|nr:MAG: universal stress protein [Gammaproteobacteria bacterium]RLA51740.1 MAG: universal stress protein [Gammaproteobacteria bacterium]